jgi:short-subunit dehydrogenase
MPTSSNTSYALVTGATSGFGYEFCKLFAADGYNLVMVARSEERLQEVAGEIITQYGVEVLPLSADLFQAEAALGIYEVVKEQGITVDVLVNDAGQGEHGAFVENDLQRELDIIQLNVTSVVCLTKYFLKEMVERNHGKVLQVASLLALYPTPLMAVYAASKAFVLAFAESLINELKDTNVSMTVLLPGASDTDFFHKAGAEDSYVYQQTTLSEPEQVAKDGYEALMKGERKVVSGLKNKVQTSMTNVLPDSALGGMMKKQMGPAEEHKKEGAEHQASREERDMIQAASNKFGRRDLESGEREDFDTNTR